MSKLMSLRGRVDPSTATRLIIDDGLFTKGFIVREFYVFPENPASGGNDSVYGTLAVDIDGSAVRWTADDARQIAWASTVQDETGFGARPSMSIIDPNHLVVRDLWFMGSRASGTDQINYLVLIEPVEISENQAVLALIKERSQDDL